MLLCDVNDFSISPRVPIVEFHTFINDQCSSRVYGYYQWTFPVDVAMETTLVERDFFLSCVFLTNIKFVSSLDFIVCLFQTLDSPTPPSRSPTQKDLKGK